MSTDINALKAAVKLVANAVADTLSLPPGAPAIAQIAGFENLIPDLFMLIPQIGQIPAELSDLDSKEIDMLIAQFAADMAWPVGKTQRVVAASIILLKDLIMTIVPDVEALLSASRS